MAPKPVDNSVNERRLRPIYDWLDNGNNKKALQETEKLLKKQPNLQCARVLKALAMIRLGRAEEAHVILKEVQAEEPYDDATLQGMVICYRETHRPELTCQIYEAAVKKDPMNEELLSHLFMSYVRVGDYRKQQQTAMALFKAKPKNPYYFWAVMSILMQTYGNDDKLHLTVTLPLAERMIKKFVDDGKIEAEAEVQLYLMVLEKEQKYEEALNVLQCPLGEKLTPMTVEAKKAEYFRLLKLWDQAMSYHEGLLRANPDQWSSYVNYVEAAFESTDRDLALTRAKNFIISLADQEKEKKENKLRGPYLARLFFWQELKKKEIDATSLFGDFKTYAQDYIDSLGDKPCAFQDLRPFIDCVSSDSAAFLKYTHEVVGLKEGESPSSLKQICRHLLYLQLSRFLGTHILLSREEKLKLSEQLWDHYVKTMPLNTGLLPTDFRPNDGYALLACHILLDAWNDDPSLLKKCLIMLETALTNSPANYHLKLLTMRAYTLAGHGRAALQRYETLDVKYIQLDSLGHLLCRPLLSMGLPNAASPILSSSLRFYATHSRETSECLISAYKYGSFGKIVEFTQFCQRLDNSVHFAAVTTERMLLDLLFDSSNHAKLVQTASGMFADSHKDQPVWSACVDNRDCRIFVSWDTPSKQLSEEVVKKTFEAEVQFARLRNRLTHAIIAAVLYTPVNQPEDKADNQTNGQLVNGKSQTPLPGLVEELRLLREEFKTDTFLSYTQLSMQAPPPPRLYSYIEDHCLDPLLILMSVICDGKNVSIENVEQLKAALGDLVESAMFSSKNTGCWKNYLRLERTYNATETLSLCAILASTIHAIMKSNHSSAAKKKKKKGEVKNEVSDPLVENFASLINCVTTEIKRIEILLDELSVEFSFDSLMLSDSSTITKEVENTTNEIKKKMSHSPSVEMKSLLSDKRKLLDLCAL